MTVTTSRFHAVLSRMGSDILYHREEGGTPCPCLTPEGFRDPTWHVQNPAEPVCNEQGYLTEPVEFVFKGSIQPASTTYRRVSQRAEVLLGDVMVGDKFAVLPCEWGGNVIDLDDWSEAGEDYLMYDSKRYTVVSFDKLADVDGDPSHHWEVGLRLLTAERPA